MRCVARPWAAIASAITTEPSPTAAMSRLLMAAVGLGSVVMALAMAAHGRATQRMMLLAATAFALFYLSLAFASSFVVGFVLLACVGASIQLFGTTTSSLLQL